MDNIIDFPNEDEVFTDEEQEDHDYQEAYAAGAMMRNQYEEQAGEVTKGMTDAERAGFWEGFYG
jgi:hypothetical protein